MWCYRLWWNSINVREQRVFAIAFPRYTDIPRNWCNLYSSKALSCVANVPLYFKDLNIIYYVVLLRVEPVYMFDVAVIIGTYFIKFYRDSHPVEWFDVRVQVLYGIYRAPSSSENRQKLSVIKWSECKNECSVYGLYFISWILFLLLLLLFQM